jgi:hypothetical protein
MVLAVVRHGLHIVNSEDGIFVELCRAWLAAMLFLEALARKVKCDAGVQDIGDGGSRNNEE